MSSETPQPKQGPPVAAQDAWGNLVESLVNRTSTPTSAKCLGLKLHQARVVYHEAKLRRPDLIDPDLKRTIRALCAGELPWPLFLWGPPGTGKTCAALLLLDHASGMYWTPDELAEDMILASKGQVHYESGRGVTPKALWREIGQRPLVVVDELGVRSKVGEWQYQCLKRLLDAREGKPLVGISNLNLKEIVQVYDDRIASRLAAGTVFHLAGKDRRLER